VQESHHSSVPVYIGKGLRTKVEETIGKGLHTKVEEITGKGLHTKVEEITGKGLRTEVEETIGKGLRTKVEETIGKGLRTKVEETIGMSILRGEFIRQLRTQTPSHNHDVHKSPIRLTMQYIRLLCVVMDTTVNCSLPYWYSLLHTTIAPTHKRKLLVDNIFPGNHHFNRKRSWPKVVGNTGTLGYPI